MRNKIATEKREKYEQEVRQICNTCAMTIEEARRAWLTKKRQARHKRDESINELRRDMES